MTDVHWFARLQLRHQTYQRVRYHYSCHPGLTEDERALTHAISEISAVRSVRFNLAARSMIIHFDASILSESQLHQTLLALTVPEPEPLSTLALANNQAPNLGGVVFSGAALLSSFSTRAQGIQLPIALTVAVPLFAEALEDLLRRGITSHVMEALAVAISVARRDYQAASTTAFLLALGEYLEHSIEYRSDMLLRHLLRPNQADVWVERAGQEQKIPYRSVCQGDTVIVATGAVIPVDGTVLSGEAQVNQATMTGESVPVNKQRGDQVLSGTVVNEGRLRVYAEKVGNASAAARIAAFVEQSLAVKSQTQVEAAQLADRLVPLVLGLAGLTYVLSRDTERVAAVLQADYSCALKLATPVAFKSAMHRAGRGGLMFKGATALERLADADTFVFDKTGTLTTGQLAVTDALTFDHHYSAEDLICLAASVEEHYVHPLALAVVDAARQLSHSRHFEHKAVEFVVAHGVASVIAGQRIVVGSRHFVEDDEQIPITPEHQAHIQRLHAEGKTLLYVGFGGRLLGMLALKDALRSNSAAVIARLRALGVKHILMLTGDHHERAAELAAELQLDAFHAELLPEQKSALLQQLSAEGAKIAFIGDGVNDAPALSQAQVGIAMHKGADIARLASDITLLEDDIARVADAKAVANATQRLISSNFTLTASLNSAILIAAALGWLSPVSASLLHNGSTVGILLRALSAAGVPRIASH